jgi:hypothetical protein
MMDKDGNAEQKKIDWVDPRKTIDEIFGQPSAIERSLVVLDANDKKAAQRKKKRHYIQGEVRIRP